MGFKKYWDEELETMPKEQLKLLEEEKLRKQIDYAYNTSPLYQRKMDEVGLKPEDIKTREDLAKIPFTTKDELRETQEKHTPFGAHQCANPKDIVRVHGTSGTTGRFILTAYTKKDAELIAECGARSLWTGGLRPDDTVFHVFNYSVYVGGLTDHLSAERLGATVFPIGVGQSNTLIKLAKEMKPTTLTSTPSYPGYLENKLRKEFDMDPRELGFKKGLFGGEPGAAIPATRKKLEDTWGFSVRDANYGLGEVIAIFGSECEEHDGTHFCGQGALLVELINPDTGEVKDIENDVEGELVYTTLDREGTPLIRYRSRDYARIISNDTCKCGRTSFRFQIIGRSDDMLWVRGVNVFPKAFEEVISTLQPTLTGEYQIVLPKPGAINTLPLRIEYNTGEENNLSQLEKMLINKFSEELRVPTKIELLPSGSIPKTEKKSQRLIKAYLGE